jgi:hypothetical protein
LVPVFPGELFVLEIELARVGITQQEMLVGSYVDIPSISVYNGVQTHRTELSPVVTLFSIIPKPKEERQKGETGVKKNTILEARVGFEPTNGGFADLSLGPLGYRAELLSIANWRLQTGGGW